MLSNNENHPFFNLTPPSSGRKKLQETVRPRRAPGTPRAIRTAACSITPIHRGVAFPFTLYPRCNSATPPDQLRICREREEICPARP